MDSLNFNSHPKAYVVEEGLLKGQSHEIDLFFALKTLPRPHKNRTKSFREFFHFVKIFGFKAYKSRILALGNPSHFKTFSIIAIGYVKL